MPGVGLVLVLLCAGHLMMTSADNTVIHELSMTRSDVHEILVSWNISDQYDVDYCSLTHQKEGSQAITYSGSLYNATDGYLISDLVPDSEYKICLILTLAHSDQCEKSEESCMECVPMSTIEIIRDDSLIAVIVTLGIILLLILIGYLCWYCAKRKLERCDDDDDDDECEHGSEVSESKQPILLSVPAGNGPRRSVDFEDQDIPYIDEHGMPIYKGSSGTHV